MMGRPGAAGFFCARSLRWDSRDSGYSVMPGLIQRRRIRRVETAASAEFGRRLDRTCCVTITFFAMPLATLGAPLTMLATTVWEPPR